MNNLEQKKNFFQNILKYIFLFYYNKSSYSVGVNNHELEILVIINIRRHIVIVLLELLSCNSLVFHTNFEIMM